MTDSTFWNKLIKKNAVLNPVDRIAEVLFGLIMVLSFTGAISASNDGRQEIHQLLWAALGCNLAWGLVDAIMYLMNVIIERGHALKILKKLEASNRDEDSIEILKEEIQPLVSTLLSNEVLADLAKRIKQISPPSKKYLLSVNDFIAGLQIFLLVFLCTLPVALPFAIFKDVGAALRVSNLIALFLLFTGGFILAGYGGFRRFITALLYTLIGLALVFLTMALGG